MNERKFISDVFIRFMSKNESPMYINNANASDRASINPDKKELVLFLYVVLK